MMSVKTLMQTVLSSVLFVVSAQAGSQADANRSQNTQIIKTERERGSEVSRAHAPSVTVSEATPLSPVGSLCVEALRNPSHTNAEFLQQCQTRRAHGRALAAKTAPKRADLECDLSAPRVIPGCQGEDCARVGSVARRTVDLYAEPSLKSKKIAKLKAGEKIQDAEVVMELRRFGKAKIKEVADLEKAAGLRKGDEVAYAAYGMLGSIQVCLGRELASVGTEDVETWQEVRAPLIQEWIQVTTSSGKMGYILRTTKREPLAFR